MTVMEINDELIDGLSYIFYTRDAWTAFTPTVDQGGAVAVTVNWARYVVIGRTVIMQLHLTPTAAGTGGNAVSVQTIPPAVQPTNTGDSAVIGTGVINDGGAYYQGAVIANGANDFRLVADGQAGFVGAAPNFALASGDKISFQCNYER